MSSGLKTALLLGLMSGLLLAIGGDLDLVVFARELAQFERDTSIGYDERYTASVGVGYKLIVSKPVDLSADIGPSVRHVKYLIGERETKLGVRGSMALAWRARRGIVGLERRGIVRHARLIEVVEHDRIEVAGRRSHLQQVRVGDRAPGESPGDATLPAAACPSRE